MTCTVLVCDYDSALAKEWVEAIRVVVTDDYRFLDAPDTDDVRVSAHQLLHKKSALRQGLTRNKQSCIFHDMHT